MIKIVCIGKLKEKHYSESCSEYLKRLGRYSRIEVVEIKEQSDKNPEVAKKKEGKLILDKIDGLDDFFKIMLDKSGRQYTSEEFLDILEKADIVFIIGGPDGLAREVVDNADLVLSISKMTFPHQLFRVLLLEQIYRGYSILNGGRYHK